MATIQQVADLAGVSTATVSRALAGKTSVSAATRERVESAAQELGYVASASASSLASGRTRNIGMVMPYLGSWYYASVLKGVHRALADAGYDLTLYHLEDTHRHAKRRQRLFDEFLRRGRVDAFIVVSLELSEAELERIAVLGKPIVGLGGPLPRTTTLSIDDAAAATLATDHLIALGHRVIAHLGGDESFEQDFHVPATRRHAYEEALRTAGLEPDPRLIKNADFTIQGGYQATLQMLGLPGRPTAVFAASDEMAIGAILAARDLGLRVPEDLSVVGIDGHELGEFFGLTTVDQFPVVQGRMAAETLLEELSPAATGEHANRDLPYELVVRKSTAVPAGRSRN